MRIFSKLISLSVFPVFLLVGVHLSISGELIEPTRTIQSPEKEMGKISVFSEPPGLDIFLDNSKIGKTPIVSVEVSPGTHDLKIEESKKEIYVIPGKTIQLSLYKGDFIEIQEEEKTPQQKPVKKTTQKKETAEPTGKKTGYKPVYEPFYWPMNPSGPIEVKRND